MTSLLLRCGINGFVDANTTRHNNPKCFGSESENKTTFFFGLSMQFDKNVECVCDRREIVRFRLCFCAILSIIAMHSRITDAIYH